MGRVDVDGMLAELTPNQLVEWRAALDVVGLDDEWQQVGVICQEMHRIALAHAGSKEEPPPRKAFHPLRLTFDAPQPAGKYLTIEEMKAASKKRAGL